MSVTAQEVLDIVYALGDELDETTGNPDDTEDLQVRTPGILTALQAELIKNGDVFTPYEISHKPTVNMLGYTSGFDYVEFTGEDKIYEVSGNVRAYYFEVSDDATVYVEDYTGSWNVLATINAAPTVGGYTAYKGVVTPTAGASKSRLRFSGTYRYVFTNYAMFSVRFASSGDVPTYRPWVKYPMPSDFKSVDQIIEEYPQRQYTKSSNYKWEGRADLYVNYYFEGNIRIIYRPIPAKITALTDVLQVDDVTARSVLPWGLGMELYKTDETKFAYFRDRYMGMKALSMEKPPVTEQPITDLYGGI
jgi:hypothetical protein